MKNIKGLALVDGGKKGDEKAAEPAAPIAEGVRADAPPAHFKRKEQKAAWADLVNRSAAENRTNEFYFTFEMAATIVDKFRSGKGLNATEHKEMKRLLIELGLAKAESNGGKKPKKNDHYFE